MAFSKLNQDDYDAVGTDNDYKSSSYEVVSKSMALTNVVNNDDETFQR